MNAAIHDEPFNLPRPGAPVMDNLIATILIQENRCKCLKLDRIAFHQGFDPAEFEARFAHLETAYDRHLSAVSREPSNSYETPEGK